MSFWGGVFGGGKSNTDFPSSSSSARSPKTQEAPHISPRSPAPPPTTTTTPTSTTTAGPPPTATAYMHSPREAAVVVQPAVVQPDAISPPPTFHIFQPKLHDESKKQQDRGATGDQAEAEQPQDLAEPQPPASQPEAPRIYIETTAQEPTEDPGSFDDDFDWEEQSEDTEEDVPSQEATPMTPEPITTDQLDGDNEEETYPYEPHCTTDQLNGDDEEEKYELTVIPAQVPSVSPPDTTSPKVVTAPTSKTTRFNFLAKEAIPIPKLEEGSTKRRHEFHTRLYEMDCHLAGLLARIVNEGVERNAALKHVFPHVCRRLEHISDRFLGNKLIFDDERSRILDIQRQASSVHCKMVKHKCETVIELQEEEFQSLQLEMLQNIQPSIKMEAQKADKREGTRFRKLDSLAGTVARRFYDESATRKAATVLLQEQLDHLSQPEKKMNFLEQLRNLRAELKLEREARRAQDAQVLSDVHETCDALKRAVLEAADGM